MVVYVFVLGGMSVIACLASLAAWLAENFAAFNYVVIFGVLVVLCVAVFPFMWGKR